MPSSRRATVRSSPHVAHRAVLCTHTHAHIPTYRANTQSKHTHTEQTHNHNGACGVSGEVCHLPCPFHTRANTPHSHIRSHSHSLTHSHAQIPQPIPPPRLRAPRAIVMQLCDGIGSTSDAPLRVQMCAGLRRCGESARGRGRAA